MMIDIETQVWPVIHHPGFETLNRSIFPHVVGRTSKGGVVKISFVKGCLVFSNGKYIQCLAI